MRILPVLTGLVDPVKYSRTTDRAKAANTFAGIQFYCKVKGIYQVTAALHPQHIPL